MATVEEVSARLEGFIREQGIANSTFAPDRDNQDMINAQVNTRMDALEGKMQEVVDQGLARVGDEVPATTKDIKELQEKLDVTDGLLAARSSELSQSLEEFEEMKTRVDELAATMTELGTALDKDAEKLSDFVRIHGGHIDRVEKLEEKDLQTKEIVEGIVMEGYQIDEKFEGVTKTIAGVDEVVNYLMTTVVELDAKLETLDRNGPSLIDARSSLKVWMEKTFATSAQSLTTYADLTKWVEGRFTEVSEGMDKLRADFDKRPVYAGEDRRPKDTSSRIVDRKNFKEKVNRFEGKGGELEVKSFIFSLKMFLTDDRKFLEILKALEKRDQEVDGAYVKELAEKGYNISDLNSQLYQILCDCAVPKSTAQQKLMALEGREEIRGLYAYWDFTRELTGSTESSKQALADRVRNPPKASSVEDLDVKIIQWEEDLKTHELFESSGIDDDDNDNDDGVQKVKMIMPESMKIQRHNST